MSLPLRKNGLIFVTPVWGYIDLFLDYCLPSLLAPQNLPSLTLPAIYQIDTTHAGEKQITSHPLFEKLKKCLPVQFHIIDEEMQKLPGYGTLNACHQRAIHYAEEKDAALVFIMPDCVFSNNAIHSLEKIALSGARLISVPYLRVNLEEATSILKKEQHQGLLDLNAYRLMKIALDHLHQITISHIWEEGSGPMLPSLLLWRVEDKGFLGRYFYSHPLMIYPRIKNIPLRATIDIDYLYQACPDRSEHYIFQDSNDLMMLELTSKSRSCSGFPKGSIEHLKYFCEHLNDYQWAHGQKACKLYCEPISQEKWRQVEEYSNQIFSDILYR